MTFEQVVDVFGHYLRRLGRGDDAGATILDFLGWEKPDDERFAKEVRIVLASAEFSRELTSSVIWLNDRGVDIRCVRLHPYLHQKHLFLDVQQLIPLPEAADYQVRLREKVQRERVARQAGDGRDFTKLTVTTPQGSLSRLPKRRAVLEVVKALAEAGVKMLDIKAILQAHHRFGSWVLCSASGDINSIAFVEAVTIERKSHGRDFDQGRYFCSNEDLIHEADHTYAITNQWGSNTFTAIDSLLHSFPDKGITYEPSGDI
jgi:hypothetical protein